MKKQIRDLLLPFYFGSIDDQSRLIIEREMLSDSEVLVEYFDLKRVIESAESIPQSPSVKLWHKLQLQLNPKKKIILSWSIGLALAASLAFFSFNLLRTTKVEAPSVGQKEILFDSGSELLGSSNVL